MKNKVIIPDDSNLIILSKHAASKPGVDPRNLVRMTPEQKKQIIDGINSGLDVSVYAKPEYDSLKMTQIRRAMENGVDIMPWVNAGYNSLDLEKIRVGLEAGLDVEVYAPKSGRIKGMHSLEMGKIITMMKKGIDPSPYLNRGFEYEQLAQIIIGLERGIDISAYADPQYSGDQMAIIREAIMSGVDPERILDKNFSAGQMSVILYGMLYNKARENNPENQIDIDLLYDYDYSPELMELILISQTRRIDVNLTDMVNRWGAYGENTFKDDNFRDMSTKQKVRFLEVYGGGAYYPPLFEGKFSDEQFDVLALGLMEGLPMSRYANPDYSVEEMKEGVEKLRKERKIKVREQIERSKRLMEERGEE